jgi:DNA-binding transcriptional LysR family regulator
VELRHLRYFVGVANELSFTRAAQKLRVAQPALSRQIRQLEDEVGVELLVRDRRNVRLTEAGAAFLAEARAILERGAEAIRIAQSTGRAAQCPLNIGYVWGLFHSVVPNVVRQFRARFPEVPVNLFDLSATEQAAALREGRLDAGFVGFAEEAETAGLAKRKVGSCEFVAAVPKSHPAARLRKVELEALANEMFFVISSDSFPGAARYVAEACVKSGFRPKTLQAAARGHTLLALVAGQCGVALVPESLQAMPHPGVVFRPLKDPPRGDLYIAWAQDRLSELCESFVSFAGMAG